MQALNCWVCGRTSDEVLAAQIDDSQSEAEFANLLAQVSQYRLKFTKSSSEWRRVFPKEFLPMDFSFVIDNPDQFKGVLAMADVTGSRRELLGWLASASTALRKQDEPRLEQLKLSSLRSEDRMTLLKSIEQFEGNWHRSLVRDDAGDSKAKLPVGFEGLALGDGLDFLMAAGSLFYDIQGMLVQFAREEHRRKVPRLEVGTVRLEAFGDVPLCDICRGMIVGLRNAAEVVEEEPAAVAAEPVQQVEPVPEPEEQPLTPLVTQRAKHVRTQEVVEDPSLQGSPGYMEIVSKLGAPAAQEEAPKEAPKPRYLHEHRLKEDWDEVVAQQAASST